MLYFFTNKRTNEQKTSKVIRKQHTFVQLNKKLGWKIEVFQNVEQNVGESKTLMTYRRHGALKTHNDIQFASDKWDKHKKAGKINDGKLCMCSWHFNVSQREQNERFIH